MLSSASDNYRHLSVSEVKIGDERRLDVDAGRANLTAIWLARLVVARVAPPIEEKHLSAQTK